MTTWPESRLSCLPTRTRALPQTATIGMAFCKKKRLDMFSVPVQNEPSVTISLLLGCLNKGVTDSQTYWTVLLLKSHGRSDWRMQDVISESLTGLWRA